MLIPLPEDYVWLVCVDCHGEYPMHTSPSDEHCGACADWHLWWSGARHDEGAA